jgi:hypothetical protein
MIATFPSGEPMKQRLKPRSGHSGSLSMLGAPGSYITNCTFMVREGDPQPFEFKEGRLGSEVMIRLKNYVIVPEESPAGQAAILAMEE